MPRRDDIRSILILGAGPIVIGQACEFDYSGAQACKALREEGYRVILVNSNPATIMTDPGMADATYIEPITWQVVEKIIAKERPDAILPTMGPVTAIGERIWLDGGNGIRFSPKYPRKILQLSTPDLALSEVEQRYHCRSLPPRRLCRTLGGGQRCHQRQPRPRRGDVSGQQSGLRRGCKRSRGCRKRKRGG